MVISGIKQKAPREEMPFYNLWCSTISYFAAAFLASLLFKLAALFLWMMPRLASLSIILATAGNLSEASFPDAALKSRMALRVVLP